MIDKPHSPACERNREPILALLREHFADRRRVLEIGSGTGQHALHFAAAMPWLTWQCSDRAAYLPGIGVWLDEAGLANTPAAVELDVAAGPWPAPSGEVSRALTPALSALHTLRAPPWERGQLHEQRQLSGPAKQQPRPRFDAAFSANSLHIMGWPQVEALFAGLDSALAADALLVVYGPFNYGGAFSSDSNRAFDASLRARDPRMGIRDFAAVDALAQAIGLRLIADLAMPANNRCLVWRRVQVVCYQSVGR